MQFVNDFSPYIFRFPDSDFGLRWYGLAYVLGFAIVYYFLRRSITNGKLPNFKLEKLDSFMFLVILGVVLGGRIGYVAQHLDRLAADPLYLIKFQEGGMAFFGGLLGVIIAIVFFCRNNKIKFGHLADAMAIPSAISVGVGRIANFINAELWGIPTNADWGVIYPNVDNKLRHPSELYESASHFALALILVFISRSHLSKKTGILAASFVLFYGLFRIITEHFRTADTYLGPFTNGQVASAIVALIGIITFTIIWKKPPKSPSPEPAP